MKKILFVESYPQVMFGQQRILLSLLGYCPKAGIEPVVAVTGDGPFVDEVKKRSIPVIPFPYPELLSSYGGAIYKIKGFRFLKMFSQLLGYVLKIRSQLKPLGLDGVYCNDMRGLLTAGIAARSLGLPLLIWDKLDKPHGWMDWFQLPLVQKNLIISNAVTQKYPSWQKAIMKNKIELVYEGANIEIFDQAKSIRPLLGYTDKDIVLAIAGSITLRKGQDRILSIWPELVQKNPNLHLAIIGSTSGTKEDERYIESLPNKNDAKIQFLGMREDIPNLMRSIDILLVPSRHEGFGLVIVEAMAASLPVIGSKTGGIPEVIVDGETGILVEGDDSGEWASAIDRLACSRDLREHMGKAGKQRIENRFNRPIQMAKVLRHCVEMIHAE